MITIRAYRPSDAGPLLTLFRDTIRRINAHDYNADQIRAWASDDIDPDRWAKRFNGHFAIVAEWDGAVAGFAEIENDGHIGRFYVSADHQRQGVGRALLEMLVREAHGWGIERLFTEASVTARPFFESQGFAVLTPQEVECRGEKFINFKMERCLKI